MPVKPFFTAENAAAFGQKGRAIQIALDASPLPDARLIRARLNDTERKMRDAANSKVLDELTRSYERLFKVYQVLIGLPGPGQRQPSRERVLPRPIQVQPVGRSLAETPRTATPVNELPQDTPPASGLPESSSTLPVVVPPAKDGA